MCSTHTHIDSRDAHPPCRTDDVLARHQAAAGLHHPHEQKYPAAVGSLKDRGRHRMRGQSVHYNSTIASHHCPTHSFQLFPPLQGRGFYVSHETWQPRVVSYLAVLCLELHQCVLKLERGGVDYKPTVLGICLPQGGRQMVRAQVDKYRYRYRSAARAMKHASSRGSAPARQTLPRWR